MAAARNFNSAFSLISDAFGPSLCLLYRCRIVTLGACAFVENTNLKFQFCHNTLGHIGLAIVLLQQRISKFQFYELFCLLQVSGI